MGDKKSRDKIIQIGDNSSIKIDNRNPKKEAKLHETWLGQIIIGVMVVVIGWIITTVVIPKLFSKNTALNSKTQETSSIEDTMTHKLIQSDKSNNQTIENSNNNIQIQGNAGNININQNKQVNESVKNLENNQVAIFATVSKLENKLDNGNTQILWNIVLQNVGKSNLYVNSYIYEGSKKNLEGEGVVLPAVPGKADHFNIVPDLGKEKTKLIMHFSDHIGKKYSQTFLLEKVNGSPQISSFKPVLES